VRLRSVSLMSACAIAFAIPATCTTCVRIAQKIKVRQFCGIVIDPTGAGLPHATLRVMKRGEPASTNTAQSDDNGNFSFGRLEKGTYEFQSDVQGFIPAVDEFEISRPVSNVSRCTRILYVYMSLSGDCGGGIQKPSRKDLRDRKDQESKHAQTN
jgi:hypothetical protein